MPGLSIVQVNKKSNRKGWLSRIRGNVAHNKAISFVETEYQRAVKSSPFLQAKRAAVPMFHRSEIEVGERLGRGGFAVVSAIAAFHLRDEISAKLTPQQRALRQRMAETATVNGKPRYAIKHLQEGLLEHTKQFQRAAADLVLEAAYMAGLNHPNVLALEGRSLNGIAAFEDGKHDGFFIITERLSDTLDARISRWIANPANETSLQDKLVMAHQLAKALEYLHGKNLVYRDLKPANIGFSATTGQVKLFDFGLSRELPRSPDGDTFVMSGVGTRRYMSPELVKGLPYNCKVDVYGWSMIVWQMFSLRKPYDDLSARDHKLWVCVMGHRPPLPKNLPASLQSLLKQCWQTSIQKRLCMTEVCSMLDVMHTELHDNPTPLISQKSWRKSTRGSSRTSAAVQDMVGGSTKKKNRVKATSLSSATTESMSEVSDFFGVTATSADTSSLPAVRGVTLTEV